jgi:hypothetical protein
MLLLNRAQARFTAPQLVNALVRDVTLKEDGTIVDTHTQRPVDTRFLEFEALSREGEERRDRDIHLDGMVLRTVASGSLTDRSFRLLRGPYGVVTTNDEQVVVAGAQQPLKPLREGHAHEVPISLPGTWLFYPTSSAPPRDDENDGDAPPPRPIDGRLALLIAHSADDRAGQELLSQAERELRDFAPPAPPDEPGAPGGDNEEPQWRSEQRAGFWDRLRERFARKRTDGEPDASWDTPTEPDRTWDTATEAQAVWPPPTVKEPDDWNWPPATADDERPDAGSDGSDSGERPDDAPDETPPGGDRGHIF